MKTSLIITTILLLSSICISPVFSQDYIEGYVYEDINQTGSKDPGDLGIANVMVSNQHEVVLTDSEGWYRLPIKDEMIVFITKPSEYDFVLNSLNLPQFYYIHHSQGSPKLEYPGIEPTGKLPQSVDFGLIASKKKDEFKALVFGDPQTTNNREMDYFRDAFINEFVGHDLNMAFVLGDIMNNNLSLYTRYNKLMSKIDVPIINIFGNHDINFDADGNRYARETFKSHYGPTYYSFNEGNAHFIVLDNIDYLGYDESGTSSYVGNLREGQLEWLSNNLEHLDNDQLIVLMAHIPLYAPGRDESASLRTNDRTQLIELLEDFKHVLFMGGHVHTISNTFLGSEFGRKQDKPIHQLLAAAPSGSWWAGPIQKDGIPVSTQRDGSPKGYHIITFEGLHYQDMYQAAGLSTNYQMRIESPKGAIALKEIDEIKIKVNVFNSSKKSKVKYRLNSGNWVKMEQDGLQKSTFFTEMINNHNNKFSNWIRPVKTRNIWSSKLPDNIKPGTHQLDVHTTDMYGNEYKKTKIIEVH
ncbi:calcineurin-like phosphoesterase family protein [Marinilabiliaceae bacterium ANBcel2]|nr:calcineurin-like phosphoesterase family protein [Marinilabiliaceae bacterium ANBcel2]